MKEQSKKQLNNSDEINNNKEQDPFTKSFEFTKEERKIEKEQFRYLMYKFNIT